MGNVFFIKVKRETKTKFIFFCDHAKNNFLILGALTKFVFTKVSKPQVLDAVATTLNNDTIKKCIDF